MTDLGDLQLRRTSGPEPPGDGPRRPVALWIAAALLLLGAAAAVYVLLGTRDRGMDAVPAAADTENPAEPRVPLGGPPTDIAIPPLEESDGLVRQLVASISSHPRVAAWLTTDGLIRNFTAVVHDISAGMTPASRLQVLAPGGAFRASGGNGPVRIDPQSYARYDSLADAVASVDAAGAARLYGTLKPRIQEAYAGQGFPDAQFDVTLERAIVRLLRTPVVGGDVTVKPHGANMFAYADPRLESLSPAQKHLLRMGPRNVRIIQEKLREIALALGIPAGRLPPVRGAVP